MQAWQQRLVEDIHFDVIRNEFWPATWGERPDAPDESRAIVVEHLAETPDLIPIYAHRAIPNEPLEAGNPVFSIWQTDIIVYGFDLADYLCQEFCRDQNVVGETHGANAAREIRFWSAMLDMD